MFHFLLFLHIISGVRRTVITDSRVLESDFYERTVVVLGLLRRVDVIDNDMHVLGSLFSVRKKKGEEGQKRGVCSRDVFSRKKIDISVSEITVAAVANTMRQVPRSTKDNGHLRSICQGTSIH